jgi:hypothetical protein
MQFESFVIVILQAVGEPKVESHVVGQGQRSRTVDVAKTKDKKHGGIDTTE